MSSNERTKPLASDLCREGECPYQIEISDDEIEAMHWLLATLDTLKKKRGNNHARADRCLRVLSNTGAHLSKMTSRVHELEDVLHAAGLQEIEIRSPERLTYGELN